MKVKPSKGMQAIEDGQKLGKILRGAKLNPALTAPQLLERARELKASVYHFELTDDGKYLGSVFVVREERLRDEIKSAVQSVQDV
jgi:hypothetical protein